MACSNSFAWGNRPSGYKIINIAVSTATLPTSDISTAAICPAALHRIPGRLHREVQQG